MQGISRTNNTISVGGRLTFDGVRQFCSYVYEAADRKGYADLEIDFSACTSAFPSAMLGICGEAARRRAEGRTISLVAPINEKLARLFQNANWSNLIDPDKFKGSTYRANRQVPAIQFLDSAEQQRVVDQLVDAMLKSLEEIKRTDLAAIEWAMNEITDNVLNHASSKIGGLVQLSTFPAKRKIDLVVVDAGAGIPKTLGPLFPKMVDYEVLKQATLEGVTRDSRFQGNGLFGSERVSVLSGGYFRLHSGFGELKIDADGMLLKPQKIPFTGTIVDICISYSESDLLQKALKFGGNPYSPIDFFERRFENDENDEIVVVIADETTSVGSRAAGAELRVKLSNYLRSMPNRRLVVDLRNISIISSSFADEVFAKLLVSDVGMEFRKRAYLLGANSNVVGVIRRSVAQRLDDPDSLEMRTAPL